MTLAFQNRADYTSSFAEAAKGTWNSNDCSIEFCVVFHEDNLRETREVKGAKGEWEGKNKEPVMRNLQLVKTALIEIPRRNGIERKTVEGAGGKSVRGINENRAGLIPGTMGLL